MSRLRHVATLVRGAGFPHEFQGSEEGDLPFFKVGDLSRPENPTFLVACGNWISRDVARELRAQIVPEGSVLLPKIGAALLGGVRRITTCSAVFDNNVLGVVPTRCEARYLRYWLGTIDLAELANPGPVPSLNDSAMLDLRVPDPHPGRQGAIADFLDAETARIDALIAKKRSLIELLEERQTAVIAAGVSGQLTATSVVPSGVPWAKTRGAAWRVAKLTLAARLGSGHTPSRDHPEWWENCTIPWITTGEVAQMRSDRVEFIDETRECISELGVANSAAAVHPAGTVVLCRTASAGYSAIMGRDMATSQDFATWTCGPLLDPRFLLLCLRAMRQDLLGRLAMGSTHQTIYMPDIASLRVLLPPIDEQEQIVDAVWRHLRPLHNAVDALRAQIDLLIEHRQALITAAVTGEIEVPGAA